MNTQNIKAIVFDAYGTLFNIQSIDQLLNTFFGNKAMEIATTWRQKQLEYTWLLSLMNRYEDFQKVTEKALQYACNRAQQKLESEVKSTLLNGYLQLTIFPEVKAACEKLSQQCDLAVLSNANYELLKAGLTFNKVDHLFKAILSVDSIKIYKPSPSVYQIATNQLNLLPKNILFISSNTWDVSGAKSFGMNVAWIKRAPNAVIEELGWTPDLVLNDLSELNL